MMKENEKLSTTSLLTELKNSKDIDGFLSKNEEHFISEDIPAFFEAMLKKYNVSKNEAIARADLDRSYGYQILKGTRNTSRSNYIRIALAIGMDLKDTQQLLVVTDSAPLYVKVKQDAAVIFCMERKMNLKETQELLYNLGLELL